MTKQYVSRSHFMFVITAIALMTSVAHAGSGVSYEGKILKADGSPEEDASVQFKLQIRTGDTADCLMYEETKTVVMTGSAGNFSVTLNDGNGARTDSTGYTIERILSNANALPVMAFSSGCTVGSETFTPAANAGRKLVLQFKDSSMASFDSFPAQTLNFAPAAIYAQQTDKIGDFGFTNLLRVADSGVPGAATPLTTANYTELVNLITGVSTQYTKAGFAGGAALPAMGSGQVLGWNGAAWQSIDPVSSVQPFAKTVLPSCAAGEYLRSSSGNLVCTTPAVGGGGTVTSVSSANGDISVSTGTSTPVLTLNAGIGPNNILKLNPSGQIPAVDGSLITGLNAGSLSTGILPVARGGTGQSAFANYSVIAANSAGNQIGIGGSTANTMLQWQVTGPAWSAATYPATTAANQLLYSSSANTIGGLATANGGVLVTNASGTPSFVSGPVGYVLTSNGSSTPAWQSLPAGSQWTTASGDIYFNTGSVGIGITNAIAPIEIAKPATAYGQLLLRDTVNAASSTTYRGWMQADDSVDNVAWRAGIWDASNTVQFGDVFGYNKVSLTTNNQPRLTADLNGFVGINTTTPNAYLHVVSTQPSGSATNVFGIESDMGNSGPGTITNAYGIRVNNVNTGGGAITNSYGLYLAPVIGAMPSSLWGVYQVDPNAQNLYKGVVRVQNAGAGVMNNDSVAITRADTGVYAAAGAAPLPNLTTGNGVALTTSNLSATTGSASYLTFSASNASSTPQRAYIATVSNATGFSPSIAFGSQSATANYTEKMRIDPNGNVGIGTTAPAYQLQLSTDSAAKPGTSTWTIASDVRLKDIRAPYTRGLNQLMGLRTVYFSYKKNNPLNLPSDKEYVGIRAQDAQKVIPESVSVDEKGWLHLTNDAIIWTAVNAIKELHVKFTALTEHESTQDREIASLKTENENLKIENENVKKRLDVIEQSLLSK